MSWKLSFRSKKNKKTFFSFLTRTGQKIPKSTHSTVLISVLFIYLHSIFVYDNILCDYVLGSIKLKGGRELLRTTAALLGKLVLLHLRWFNHLKFQSFWPSKGVKIEIFEKSFYTLLDSHISNICTNFLLSNPYVFRKFAVDDKHTSSVLNFGVFDP